MVERSWRVCLTWEAAFSVWFKGSEVSCCLALPEGRTAKRQICNCETVIFTVKTGKNQILRGFQCEIRKLPGKGERRRWYLCWFNCIYPQPEEHGYGGTGGSLRRKSCCGAGAGVGGDRRGRDGAALVMLWGEAGLPELRVWCIADWKDVVGIAAGCPPQAGQTPRNASHLSLGCWST